MSSCAIKYSKIKDVLLPNMPDEHKQAFNRLLVYHNLLRLRVIAKYLLAFMVIFIVIQTAFVSKVHDFRILDTAPSITALRFFHMGITILFLYWAKSPPNPERINPRHKFYVYGYLVYNLVYFAILTSLIQSVVYGIAVSYIMAVLVSAAFIYLNLLQRLSIFSIAWLSMTIATWCFQTDWIVALSVILNCTVMSILGIAISTIIYTGKVNDYLNQQNLMYQSYHDELTGLYNRRYVNEIIEDWSNSKSENVGVIVCDIDGLKLINDTMGHQSGDELLLAAARVIKESVRTLAVIARIGGDEFMVILPGAWEADVQNTINNINSNLRRYNKINADSPLSISCGYAVGSNGNKDISKLLIEADDNMYKEKLYHNQSNRSNIIKTLMKALEARDHITEGHAERLQNLIIMVAKDLSLPEHRLLDLRLLAQFHDIGKVGIADSILFKPGPLTAEEKLEMQRHSEIGYRIALSSPELSPIADFILKHHEWWNGGGYPLGLKGDQIPLECRLISIADAYDAMTSERPYRKAMSKDEALNELKKFAGIQFAPDLITKFIEILSKKT